MEALERVVANCPAVHSHRTSARELCSLSYDFDTLPGLIGRGEPEIHPDEEVDWALGTELLSNRPIYVPLDAAVLDRTRRNRFWMSSDGLASGNTLEEAILHGVLERIERDAYCLWQIGPEEERLARCLDARSFNDPVLDVFVRKIETAGLVVRLFDMMTDINVACITAVIGPSNVYEDTRFVEITGGSGAHPVPARAAIRAVTEAAQSRITYISGARDDLPREVFSKRASAETLRTLAAVPRLVDASKPTLTLGARLIDEVLGALRTSSIGPVIALPIAAPTLPFHVAKVFVPGLENPDGARARRYGPRAIAKAVLS